MALTKRRLQAARKQGISEDEIFDVILDEYPDFAEKAKELVNQGASKSNINEVIAEEKTRGTLADVALQIPTSILTGLTGAPRAALEGVQGLAEFVQEPRQTGANFVRSLVGLDPQEQEKQPELLERFLEPETFESLKESLGIGALERGGRAVGEALSKPFQAIKEFFPTTQEARGRLERDIGESLGMDVDLDPATTLGQLVSTPIERGFEALPLGPEAALAMAGGGFAGQTARELGAPEFVARDVDLATSLLSLKPKKTAASEAKPIKTIRDISDDAISDFVKQSKPFEIDATGNSKVKIDRYEPKNYTIQEPINAVELSRDIANAEREPILNRVYQQDLGREGSVNALREAVTEQKTRDRGKVSNLYAEVEPAVNDLELNVNPLQESFLNLENTLEERGIIGTGESELAKVLTDIRNELFGIEEEVEGVTELLEPPISTVGEAIRINKSLNDRLAFNITDPGKRQKAINTIKPFKKRLTEIIDREIKQKTNKETFTNWRAAQRGHQNWVEKFSQDHVVDLLTKKDEASYAKGMTKKDRIDAIKKVIPKESEANSVLERLVLEELDFERPSRNLRRDYRDLRTSLSEEAAAAGQQMIDINDPLSFKRQSEGWKNTVLREINEAAVTGTAPASTLKMMHTPKGYSIVKDALSTTTDGRKAFESLQNIFIDGHMQDIFKNGVLNTDNLKKFLRSDDLVSVYRQIAGDGAVNFLEDLQADANEWSKIFDKRAFKERSRKAKKAEVETKTTEPKKVKFLDDPMKWVEENRGKTSLAYPFLKAIAKTKTGKVFGIGTATVVPLVSRAMKSQKIRSLLKTIKTRPGARATAILQLDKELQRIREDLSEKED